MKSILVLSLFSFLLAVSACKAKTEADTTSDTATAASGTGDEWKIDTTRSRVNWFASKPTNSHHGYIPIKEGNIVVSGDQITGGKVILDVAHITALEMEGDSKQNLENHLRGTGEKGTDDFFNTTKYPTGTFVITNMTKIDNDPNATHQVTGDLTLRDITKSISFNVKADMAAGNAVKVTSESFTIDRTEWGIKFQSKKFFDDLKDDFINDEVKIDFVIGAIRE